ncbi:hypothetical protein N9C16_05355 [Paracoccaceae bacterium]|nr:hypothetical protein [Paracoccaceae bacterium]
MRAAWLGGNGRHVVAQNAKAQHTSTMATADSTGGLSTGARAQQGLQRISEVNLKHGRQTKGKLLAQRHAAEVGRRAMSELKRIERRIVDAGLMPED